MYLEKNSISNEDFLYCSVLCVPLQLVFGNKCILSFDILVMRAIFKMTLLSVVIMCELHE